MLEESLRCSSSCGEGQGGSEAVTQQGSRVEIGGRLPTKLADSSCSKGHIGGVLQRIWLSTSTAHSTAMCAPRTSATACAGREFGISSLLYGVMRPPDTAPVTRTPVDDSQPDQFKVRVGRHCKYARHLLRVERGLAADDTRVGACVAMGMRWQSWTREAWSGGR